MKLAILANSRHTVVCCAAQKPGIPQHGFAEPVTFYHLTKLIDSDDLF